MADPTLVNGQMTDAVTQVNLKVLGEAPAQALASQYQTFGNSAGMAIQNAVANQHQFYAVGTSVTTQAVNLIMSIDSATTVRGLDTIFSGNSVASNTADLLAAARPTGRG